MLVDAKGHQSARVVPPLPLGWGIPVLALASGNKGKGQGGFKPARRSEILAEARLRRQGPDVS